MAESDLYFGPQTKAAVVEKIREGKRADGNKLLKISG